MVLALTHTFHPMPGFRFRFGLVFRLWFGLVFRFRFVHFHSMVLTLAHVFHPSLGLSFVFRLMLGFSFGFRFGFGFRFPNLLLRLLPVLNCPNVFASQLLIEFMDSVDHLRRWTG